MSSCTAASVADANHRLLGDGGVPEREVVVHGCLEEPDVLIDERDGRGHQVRRQVGAVHAVEQDLARPGPLEARGQAGNGRLAARRRPDEGDALARRDPQGEVLDQGRLERLIAEGDPAQLEVSGERRRPRPGEGRKRARGAGADAVRRRTGSKRARIDRVLQDVVQVDEAGGRLAHRLGEGDQLTEGAREPGDQDLEGDQGAEADGATDDLPGAHTNHGRSGHAHHRHRHRRSDRGKLHEVALGVDELGLLAGPPREQQALVARRLDRLDGREARHRGRDHGPVGPHHPRVRVLLAPPSPEGDRDVAGGQAHGDEGELPVVDGHQHHVEDRGHHAQQGGRKLAGQQSGDLVVERHSVDHLARVALGKETHR